MTIDDPGSGGARPGWPQPAEPDDLDRAFGPDTAAAPVRTPKQRVGRGALVAGGVVVTAVVIAVVLLTIVGSVQDGVGGVFPRPQAALDRFHSLATDVDGVRRVEDQDPTKTSFASYDVQSTVTLEPTLSDARRTAAVRALQQAADDVSGNGVRVFAVADLGALQVGISADRDATDRRLALARQLDAIGGVSGARCSWADDAPSDEPSEQTVTVVTHGTGNALGAIVAKATQETHTVFPGAAVESAAP